MSKYKKIFSGLGLLSISTLIGASVVACARTKVEKEETPAPGTSDSKDLVTIKNEASVEVEKLQGHEKYAELKAIIDKENATIEELNSAKTSATEELNKYKKEVQTAVEAITDNAKKEELKKEIETANSYNDLKTIKDKIESKSSPDAKPENDGKDNPDKKESETDNSNQGKNEGSTGKDNSGKTEPEKGRESEGKNTTPKDGKEQMPPKAITVDGKVKMLYSLADQIPYPDQNTTTKQDLKAKVDEIKNKNVADDEKLKQLDELEKTFIEYSSKIEKYNKILEIGFKLDTSFPVVNKNGLNSRLSKLFSNDPEKKFTEEELIWQIYETIRQKGFEAKINKYAIISKDERNKDITESGITKITEDKKTAHGLNVDQLQEKINKMTKTVILVAKKAADLNADKIVYKDGMDEKPIELIKKIKSFTMKATTITEVDDIIAKTKEIAKKVQEVVTSATKNKDDKIKDKINKIDANNVDEVITKLGKLKPASSTPSKTN
ncbi:hypothetical protein RRG53_01395 [Mycoplasmopsis cynos]|uniref:hypothetical protein n=1 Tax=Mycoplasmopsis cynos TaxID=171284 RepID=UPI002B003C24|nr:hypothetical protein [Mycoplasmopsis cynos]WQQ18711.1 hypothetical protein RRG53_01395 [Mycoplasmopsis cynos]